MDDELEADDDDVLVPDEGWPDCKVATYFNNGVCPFSDDPWHCPRSMPCANQVLYADLTQIRDHTDGWSEMWLQRAQRGEPLGPRVISGDPNELPPPPGDELL